MGVEIKQVIELSCHRIHSRVTTKEFWFLIQIEYRSICFSPLMSPTKQLGTWNWNSEIFNFRKKIWTVIQLGILTRELRPFSRAWISNLKVNDVMIWPRCPCCLRRTIKYIVPFGSSYLCEARFSVLICIKTKYRTRLDVTAEMRCALSTTSPDFEKLQRDVHKAISLVLVRYIMSDWFVTAPH
jgi:hypothetical protein